VHDKVTARFYFEFSKTCEDCLNRAAELRMPLLVFHGTEDKIVDCRGSEMLFNKASSRDKNIHLFDGFYHETMNEIGKQKVLQIVSRWIVKAISGKKISKGAKKNRRKKPIKGVVPQSVKKIKRRGIQIGSPAKRRQKNNKKGVKKIVGTKKSAKKKKPAKKSSKKSSKKKK
jgi:hypothetical protein